MKFTKTVQLAFGSIMSNKLRSLLTMLGIIIGVGAVIILVSIMDGITGQVTDAFESFGMNNITVSMTSRGSTRYIEPDDMYEIIDENPELFTYCTPNVSLMATVKAKNTTDNEYATVTGIDETYDKINQLETEQGRFLQFSIMLVFKLATSQTMQFLLTEFETVFIISTVLFIGEQTNTNSQFLSSSNEDTAVTFL